MRQSEGVTTTLVIATLGPASSQVEDAAALRSAGADGVRLNGSHLDANELARMISVALGAGFEASTITLDLQGGKTRVEELGDPVDLTEGDEVTLSAAPAPGPSGSTPMVGVDRPELLQALQQGDTLRVDDGRLTLRIVQVSAHGARARALGAGRIAGRKGLALVGREVALPPHLLDRDRELVGVAVEWGVGALAVSYAAVPGLLQVTREIVRATSPSGFRPKLVAKLEQPEALERMEDILSYSDAVWLCRGDLGAEVGLARLPGLQRRLLDATLERATVLVAGQLLHHMTVSPRPTRSEVCHIGDLVQRGVGGFVLSDETATGPHGREAVRSLREIVDEAAASRQPPDQEV